MKKNFKNLFTLVFMCTCLLMSGTTAYAQSVSEADDNDTKETAQLIQSNSETAAEAVSGSRPNQYVVNGYTSTDDDDWYKVYLTSGIQYVTCNADSSFYFEVWDSEENIITSETYVKSGFGVTAYPFNVEKTGYYYIKVTGTTSSQKNYNLLVGGPTYTVADCEVKFTTITMKNKEDEVVTFNLSSDDRLPENAVIYTISMNGVKTTSVSSVAVTNMDTGKIINLATYTWSKSGLVSSNYNLKSNWEIKFGYNKATSFTPSIKLYYAYPVVSTYVDDIVITQ